MFRLETAHDRLEFRSDTGQLHSFRRREAPEQEFVLAQPNDPVFVIQYLDADSRFRQITSLEAAHVSVTVADGELSMAFDRLGGLDLQALVAIHADLGQDVSRWRLTITNSVGIQITDVQFPFIVAPYGLGGSTGSERLLWPIGAGKLIAAPRPDQLEPDSPHAWQLRPENGAVLHYPGFTVAQFLAYFNDRAGIFLGCEDPHGNVKLIKPVHRGRGLRLGVSHIGDFPQEGSRALGYDVVVRSFTGDWYAAAEIYRTWSQEQPWAQRPLHQRTDVPAWLLDSPPHIVVRIQGELDVGPTEPNHQFLPYPKTIPLLEAVSRRIDSPVIPIIMSWERGGPWVYPDCFPPAGGSDSLREFTRILRDRDWHVGTFCNGTRWVIGHYWSGYDGLDVFQQRNAASSISRTHANELWQEQWDATWRPSYLGCLGTVQTRDTADHFLRIVIDELGLDWVQFLDQNVGCAAFPCFANDHEHPATPGHWMTEDMEALVRIFKERAAHARAADPSREIVFSVEGPVNEYFMPDFQVCDIRVVPPGMRAAHPLWWDWVPLYHFLFHEYILIQGGFGHGADPHHLAIRNAYNLVVGEIPGAVLKGDGDLLNVDSPDINWAPWEPQVGDNEEALAMLRSATGLRRGPGRDYLVFGRMLAPAKVEEIDTVRWQDQGLDHRIPAVFHAAWQAPDGRIGVVLANWTRTPQHVFVSDERLGDEVLEHVVSDEPSSRIMRAGHRRLDVHLPPLGCVLLESTAKSLSATGRLRAPSMIAQR